MAVAHPHAPKAPTDVLNRLDEAFAPTKWYRERTSAEGGKKQRSIITSSWTTKAGAALLLRELRRRFPAHSEAFVKVTSLLRPLNPDQDGPSERVLVYEDIWHEIDRKGTGDIQALLEVAVAQTDEQMRAAHAVRTATQAEEARLLSQAQAEREKQQATAQGMHAAYDDSDVSKESLKSMLMRMNYAP
jgi:hypothetical protein